MEIFNSIVQQAADGFNIPTVSVFDAFNGPDHDEDPREKGYIGPDGVHTSVEGRQLIADLLSEAGYEPIEP
jgi:lysophospholipase L1-like esterase